MAAGGRDRGSVAAPAAPPPAVQSAKAVLDDLANTGEMGSAMDSLKQSLEQIKQTDAKQVAQMVLDGIIDCLATEGRLELRQFGVFEVRTRKPRTQQITQRDPGRRLHSLFHVQRRLREVTVLQIHLEQRTPRPIVRRTLLEHLLELAHRRLTITQLILTTRKKEAARGTILDLLELIPRLRVLAIREIKTPAQEIHPRAR